MATIATSSDTTSNSSNSKDALKMSGLTESILKARADEQLAATKEDDMSAIGSDSDMGSSEHMTHNTMLTSAKEAEETKKIQEELSKRESRNVFRLRLIVMGVLICTAAIVSSVVYMIVRDGQEQEFKNQYEGAASKVVAAFEQIMIRMESVAGLATAYTSQGMHHNAWPFISMEEFPPQARNALALSGSLWIGMHPIITNNYFRAWDTYSQDPANYDWM